MGKEETSIFLMTAVLLMTAAQGFGTVFNDGGYYSIDYSIEYISIDPGVGDADKQTTVDLRDGCVVNNTVTANGNSIVRMFGGTVGSEIIANDYSQVTIFDGSVGYNLITDGHSEVTMSGGSVSNNLYVKYVSQFNWSGGTIGNLILLDSSNPAVLIINGSDFEIDGELVGSGNITSILGGYYTDEPIRQLTGTLSSGDIIDNNFKIGGVAEIVLIPEPATLLLLGLGAVMLRRKR